MWFRSKTKTTEQVQPQPTLKPAAYTIEVYNPEQKVRKTKIVTQSEYSTFVDKTQDRFAELRTLSKRQHALVDECTSVVKTVAQKDQDLSVAVTIKELHTYYQGLQDTLDAKKFLHQKEILSIFLEIPDYVTTTGSEP